MAGARGRSGRLRAMSAQLPPQSPVIRTPTPAVCAKLSVTIGLMMFRRFPAAALTALTALALLAAPARASTVANLVTNGSFEDLSGTGLSGSSWGVFTAISGWTTASGAGIELQLGNVGGALARDGKVKVELDSHGAGSNSSMMQKLDLAAGRYLLSFAYMGRIAGNPVETNRIDYAVLGSELAGTISRSFGAWEVVTALFRTDGSGVALTFTAGGRQDTLGGYIDAVSVTPAAVPLPPALPLLAAALGLLPAARRRRRAA